MIYWSEIVRLFEGGFAVDGWKVYPCSKKGFGAGLIENEVDKILYVITGSDSESRPLPLKRIKRVGESFSTFRGKKMNVVIFIGRLFSEQARNAVEDGGIKNMALLELGLLETRPSPKRGLEVFAPPALKRDFLVLKLKEFLRNLLSELGFKKRRPQEPLKTFPPFQKMKGIRQEILSGKVPTLRHDIPFVCASDISEQYYCEMKVELRYRLGERPSELMETGVEAHKDLLKEAEKAQHLEVWGVIASGEGLFANTLTLAEYNGIPIPGRPDWIYFRDRRPILVFEYKFRTGRIRPYSSDHVQAGIYSWILKELGFDITELKYALVISPQLCKGCEKMRGIHKFILDMNARGVNMMKICECAKVRGREPWGYIYSPDYSEIEEELRWALEYWRSERNPIPTSNRNKCKKCGHRNECPALKVAGNAQTSGSPK